VSLYGFEAEKENNTTGLLSWKTASEQNSAYFEVERSADGINYTSIGRVVAAGNSSTERLYTFRDKNPVTGVNYYRLQMVDIDSKSKVSDRRVLNFEQKNTVTIFPNPAGSYTTISGIKAGMKVYLVASDGRNMGVYTSTGNSIEIPLTSFSKGLYTIQIIDKNGAVIKTDKLN